MRIRFTIRTLLLLVTAASIVLGIRYWLVRPVQRSVSVAPIDPDTLENSALRMKRKVKLWLYQRAAPYGWDGKDAQRPGRHAVSWRVISVQLSSALQRQSYTSRVPWNAKANAAFDNAYYRGYCFDADRLDEWEKHYTNFVAIRGEGTAFDTDTKQELPKDAIVLVEVSTSLQCEWMKPFDFDHSKMPRTIGDPKGIAGNYPNGFLVAFADAKVWMLENSIPFEKIEMFLTCESAEANDRADVLGPYVLRKWE